MYLVYSRIPGHKEFAMQQLDKFAGNHFNFQPVRAIKTEFINDYEKIFVSGSSFQPTKKLEKSRGSYAFDEHVKSYQYRYIDKGNRTLLLSDKPLEIVIAMLEEKVNV